MIRLKLDENFSPSLTELFHAAGLDAHSVLGESLSGASDDTIYEACIRENRCLITFDTDFCNILNYPADGTQGIIVVRPNRPITLASMRVISEQIIQLLQERSPESCLWVLEPDRLRIPVEDFGDDHLYPKRGFGASHPRRSRGFFDQRPDARRTALRHQSRASRQAIHPTFANTELIKKVEIMGDTSGSDLGFCGIDNTYLSLYFNPLRVKFK
ncbi:MAG: DUF5615 family PIN-like protein [Saprospiraceae bacterium]